jgi:glutathione S-transferase
MNDSHGLHGYAALVTLLALTVYLWMFIRVGSARGRFGVEAPAVTGHPEFERHFRVQANTLEGLIIFLPALWLFAIYLNEAIAAGLGLIWVGGRVMYMLSYAKDPKTRSAGFGVQALATVALLFGAAGAVVWALLKPLI